MGRGISLGCACNTEMRRAAWIERWCTKNIKMAMRLGRPRDVLGANLRTQAGAARLFRGFIAGEDSAQHARAGVTNVTDAGSGRHGRLSPRHPHNFLNRSIASAHTSHISPPHMPPPRLSPSGSLSYSTRTDTRPDQGTEKFMYMETEVAGQTSTVLLRHSRETHHISATPRAPRRRQRICLPLAFMIP